MSFMRSSLLGWAPRHIVSTAAALGTILDRVGISARTAGRKQLGKLRTR
jgi:hypothetical protein